MAMTILQVNHLSGASFRTQKDSLEELHYNWVMKLMEFGGFSFYSSVIIWAPQEGPHCLSQTSLLKGLKVESKVTRCCKLRCQ